MTVALTHFRNIIILGILMLATLSPSMAQESEDQESQTLGRTEALLKAVEQGILTELKQEENELKAEAATATSQAMGDAEREAQVRLQDEAMREKARMLSAKIEVWATNGEELIQVLTSGEMNTAMAEARSIAKYFGLDVEHLGKLYTLGKQTIKGHEFILPNALPPDKDESYSRYFSDFFTFAHHREEELSEYRKEQQEWRVTLFKRVTLAYIRALLASTEPVPSCNKIEPAKTVSINGQNLKGFGCQDPVVERLRAYVQGVQKIASAESGRFNAEAQVVLARQELTTDMAGGLPLVGDAMDFYNLYAGKDLAGRCLTRFDYGITTIFAALPFMPSGWATQVVKRLGMEDHLSSLIIFMAHSAEWSEEMIAGLAKRFGMTPEHFVRAQEAGEWLSNLLMTEIATMPSFPKGSQWLKDTAEKFGIPESSLQTAWETMNTDISELMPNFAPDGVIAHHAAKSLRKPVDSDAVLARNIQQAAEGQRYLRNLAPEIVEKTQELSRKRLKANLYDVPANQQALAGDFSEVKKLSNLVHEHVDTLLEEAKDMEAVVFMRYVNEHSTEKIAQNFSTKPMPVKGKSADWGPQAAFLPVDQQFSKLGKPGNKKPGKIDEFSGIVQDCLQNGPCEQTDLVLANGDKVMVWKGPQGERPIVKRGNQYLDHDSGEVLPVKPGEATPMKVIALPHPETNELIPVTADYDMLAVGGKRGVDAPEWRDAEGYVSNLESEFKDRANKAFKERNNYQGGNLIHHGAEAQYTGSPGAFADDPLITVVDPDLGGPLTIPRCEKTCMEKWCETTGQCGNMPICDIDKPKVPCMQVDPARLLKDFFHQKRLDGYTGLSPNSAWRWGEYNGLAGWTPTVVLDSAGSTKPADWIFGQYVMEMGIKQINQGASRLRQYLTKDKLKQVALYGIQQLFSCPRDSVATAP